MEKNLTQGSIFKNIVIFSLPFLFSYFLQTLYGLADLYIIGLFCSTEATTAVSIGSQVMHMMTVMVVGLAMGTTVLIGKSVGAQDGQMKRKTIGNTITLFACLSIVLTILMLLLSGHIVDVMSTPAEAVSGTTSYLRICFAGIPFIVAYNIISALFRGMGDSKSPMYFIMVACFCNILLDLVFIGGFKMGPAGAALGTTLSQTVSVIVSLTAIIKMKMISGLRRSDFIPDKTTLGDILKVGVPVMAQDGFIQISFILITVFANRRGLSDAAAVGVVEKLIGILFLVPSSLLSTVSAICAQNIGAGLMDRAKKTLFYSACLAVGFGMFFAISFQFLAPAAVGLFSDDSEVIRLGATYMRSYVWDCVLAGVHFTFSGYFCARSKSGISFLHNVVSIIVARIPIAYWASITFKDTLYPMGWGAPIGSLVSVIICVIAFCIIERNKEPYNARF